MTSLSEYSVSDKPLFSSEDTDLQKSKVYSKLISILSDSDLLSL